MMRTLPLLLLTAACVFCQEPPPILDMHLHALPVEHFGSLGIKACPGDVAKSWPAMDPQRSGVTADDLEDCPNPDYALKTDDAVFEVTRGLLEKFNITGVLSGPEEYVSRWTDQLGDRVIPAILVWTPGNPPLERLSELAIQKKVRVIGEVALQYAGISPGDQAFEPYWDFAERNDIPVGIHIGPGPGGGVDVWNQKEYRVTLSDPGLLEPVLIRHPKLRVYIMHAGWPMADRMIHMLYTYPRLYVDTGVIDWYLPRKEFHHYLKRLVEAGFGSRIMFGSDQMIWPKMIEVAIESIQSAEFLSPQQKRDIFFNNARRFLRLPIDN